MIQTIQPVANVSHFGMLCLAVPREFPADCFRCGSRQMFIADYQIGDGFWGYCRRCGDERIAPWTRTTSGECA
jgi:hypothetical protein